MFSEPSPGRIIAAVQKALREVVTPAVSGKEAAAAMAAIDLMLGALGRRMASEPTYMRAEIDDICILARSCIDRGLDGDNALAQMLDRLEPGGGFAANGDLAARYRLAGLLLNGAIEIIFRHDDVGLRRSLDELVGRRVQHETELLGAFEIVGKT